MVGIKIGHQVHYSTSPPILSSIFLKKKIVKFQTICPHQERDSGNILLISRQSAHTVSGLHCVNSLTICASQEREREPLPYHTHPIVYSKYNSIIINTIILYYNLSSYLSIYLSLCVCMCPWPVRCAVVGYVCSRDSVSALLYLLLLDCIQFNLFIYTHNLFNSITY